MALETKEVKLKNKTVVLRELTGADEMLAIKLMGKELDTKQLEASQMTEMGILLVLSIFKIDDEFVKTPNTFEEALKTLTEFKYKEIGKLRQAWVELNGGDEDFSGEQT